MLTEIFLPEVLKRFEEKRAEKKMANKKLSPFWRILKVTCYAGAIFSYWKVKNV